MKQLLIIIIITLSFASFAAADDMPYYMHIPGVKGDVVDADRLNWIEIDFIYNHYVNIDKHNIVTIEKPITSDDSKITEVINEGTIYDKILIDMVIPHSNYFSRFVYNNAKVIGMMEIQNGYFKDKHELITIQYESSNELFLHSVGVLN